MAGVHRCGADTIGRLGGGEAAGGIQHARAEVEDVAIHHGGVEPLRREHARHVAAGDADGVHSEAEARRREGCIRGEYVFPLEHGDGDAADARMTLADLGGEQVLPAIDAVAGAVRGAHAEQDEDSHPARTAARGGAGEIDGVELFAETFEGGIGSFVSGLERGLCDLVPRDGCVCHAAPVILGPETSAQPNHVAHKLLPSSTRGMWCTPRAKPPVPGHATLLLTQRSRAFRS